MNPINQLDDNKTDEDSPADQRIDQIDLVTREQIIKALIGEWAKC
jgi:hypothetical protein